MAAPNQTIKQKLEDATRLLLEAVDDLPAGLGFFMAMDDEEVKEPAVLISSQDVGVPPDETNIEPTGNRALRLSVVLRTHTGDTSRDEHYEIMGRFRDELMTDDITARLSAAVDDFTAYYIDYTDDTGTAEGHSLTGVLMMTLWCAPSDF